MNRIPATDWQSDEVHQAAVEAVQRLLPVLATRLPELTHEQWEGLKLRMRDAYREGYRAAQGTFLTLFDPL